MTDNEIIQQWIKNANEGRIKIGTRELTNDENALIVEVLQCVGADIASQDAPEPVPACICAEGVTKCPRHGDQPARRGLCPKCGSVLGYCAQGQYCTSESCKYVN